VDDWTVCTYVCICGGCLGGSVGCRSCHVVTGARCPLTKPVVTAVELQATTGPHCSRGVQPGGIYVYVGTARADSRRSGVGLAPRPQALPMPAAALIQKGRPAPRCAKQAPPRLERQLDLATNFRIAKANRGSTLPTSTGLCPCPCRLPSHGLAHERGKSNETLVTILRVSRVRRRAVGND
jgi:hypothetical protein